MLPHPVLDELIVAAHTSAAGDATLQRRNAATTRRCNDATTRYCNESTLQRHSDATLRPTTEGTQAAAGMSALPDAVLVV
jgi:hypothetical protein